MISTVAWAVPPGARVLNRPVRLTQQLIALGAISPDYVKIHHGHSVATDQSEVRSDPMLPSNTIRSSDNVAILSPVFLPGIRKDPKWIDLYDDWSLAPDINPLYRILAHSGYRQLSALSGNLSTFVSVNSEYLARKIGRQKVRVVPNGVDPILSTLPQTGDEVRRLIILGHFFAGRTDFQLLERIAMLPFFDEILIGGKGRDSTSIKFFQQLSLKRSGIKVREWIDEVDLAAQIGPRTVALIPNRVTDYTLSQDLMKAYTFMSLGLPTICPAPLWPSTLERDFAFLVGHGDRLVKTLPEWVESERPKSVWRDNISLNHSWNQRARMIAECL